MCAQPVQAIPRRYTRSTWALVQRCVGSNSFSSQWTPRTRFSEPLPRSTKRRRQGSGPARRGPGAAGCKYPVRAAQHARPPSCQPVEHAMPAMHTTRAGYLSMCSPLPAERHDLSLVPFSIRNSSLLFFLSSFFFFPFRFFCARREQKHCIPLCSLPPAPFPFLTPYSPIHLTRVSPFHLSSLFDFFFLILVLDCPTKKFNIVFTARLPTRSCHWWTARTQTSRPISFHTTILPREDYIQDEAFHQDRRLLLPQPQPLTWPNSTTPCRQPPPQSLKLCYPRHRLCLPGAL